MSLLGLPGLLCVAFGGHGGGGPLPGFVGCPGCPVWVGGCLGFVFVHVPRSAKFLGRSNKRVFGRLLVMVSDFELCRCYFV